MAVWAVYLSLCLLFALSGSDKVHPRISRGINCKDFNLKVCKPGWIAYNCRCFKFFNIQRSWIEAEKMCLSYGGNLASIHSYEEYLFIKDMIKAITYTFTVSWIGGTNCISDDTWLWSDGSSMNFKLWNRGEPNNNIDEHCIEMTTEESHHWNDQGCGDLNTFVCAMY